MAGIMFWCWVKVRCTASVVAGGLAINLSVLVTGASGFIGSAVAGGLCVDGYSVRVALRESLGCWPDGIEEIAGCELTRNENWARALSGVDVVIHCAARVAVNETQVSDVLETFREINVRGTLRVARLAAESGVRRFILVSSVKVHGEATNQGLKFNENHDPLPRSAYGQSKLEAEAGLKELSAETGMEVVCVRCPLVYGPGAKGNFRALVRLADSPWPLPLAGVRNARSLIYIGNLVNFLVRVLEAPQAGGQVFLVSDGEDVSTSNLVSDLRVALGRPERLFFFPWISFRTLIRVLGLKAVSSRLLDSMQVDISKARTMLGWQPPYSRIEGLAKTVDGIARNARRVESKKR